MRRIVIPTALTLLLLLASGLAGAAHAATATSVALDPALPTTADTIQMHVELDPNAICWHQGSVWDDVQVSGRTVRIRGDVAFFADPLLCSPRPVFDFSVPALAAGSWSVEVSYLGTVVAAQAFEVTAPSTTLELRTARFAATARWRGADGVEHQAQGVSTSDEAGYFWFFDRRNVELTLKLLDGTPINHHYWVFIASMTNVAYTVTVHDRSIVCIAAPCPNEKTYVGVAGKNQNVLDTEAF